MTAAGTLDVRAAAGELIAGLVARPWGQVSASVYETGRLVTLAPWLTGHEQRLAYLVATQRPDGGWGAPDAYALVPTLSATEALLTATTDGRPALAAAANGAELAAAATRGLRMLLHLLPRLDATSVPDTPAADLIVTALIESINTHLDRLTAHNHPRQAAGENGGGPTVPASELADDAVRRGPLAGPDDGRPRAPEGLADGQLGASGALDGARLRPPGGTDGTRLRPPAGRDGEPSDAPGALESAERRLPATLDGGQSGAAAGPDDGRLGALAGLDGVRLRVPAGLDGGRRAKIQVALGAGVRPPEKLLHALEVVGDVARGVRTVRPAPLGTVGASPAATAAWLDGQGAHGPARRFLEIAVTQHGGPVPCGLPITVFERAWVVTTLARAGLASDVPAELVDSLRPALAPGGTPAGDGLPADADTTSVALYALGLLGVPYRPDGLWTYRTDTHFCTWPGEDGFSVTTNAHVLEAIGYAAAPQHAETVRELAALLRDHQRDDGSWYDRWHASPYYATACCALALDRFGGAASRRAVSAAVRLLLATQRPDGSWGHWTGTAEETAYAMQVLLLTRPDQAGSRAEAIAHGYPYLLRAAETAAEQDAPPLWHDKDLYRPTAIVRAAVLAALHLARSGGAR